MMEVRRQHGRTAAGQQQARGSTLPTAFIASRSLFVGEGVLPRSKVNTIVSSQPFSILTLCAKYLSSNCFSSAAKSSCKVATNNLFVSNQIEIIIIIISIIDNERRQQCQ